jgi:hypothetical protein
MNYILFTTTRCPKCPAFKEFVTQNIKLSGEILDETAPDFNKKITAHQVGQAPTILFFEKEEEVFRSGEIPLVQDFLKNV